MDYTFNDFGAGILVAILFWLIFMLFVRGWWAIFPFAEDEHRIKINKH